MTHVDRVIVEENKRLFLCSWIYWRRFDFVILADVFSSSALTSLSLTQKGKRDLVEQGELWYINVIFYRVKGL